MKRRTLLLGTGTLAAGVAGTLLWKPSDNGAPHNDYFSTLNQLLKDAGPGRPSLIVDRARMNHNIDQLVSSVGPDKTYRVVVKSLPSIELLRHVTERANTQALMVFHQPVLNLIAESFPQSDVLLGKPMPVQAARTFYEQHTKFLQRASPVSTNDAITAAGAFDPAAQLQWLIDSPARLAEYQALAQALGIHMRINVEIDVGLHRGGLEDPAVLTAMLATIADNPEHLSFAGLMGYEPHL
ncbi:MAG: alanine racemase, partial [Pseudomonadota bacterium]